MCGGALQFDPRGPWLNFDHHADVDRLSSRASSSQILLALRQGLFDRESSLYRRVLVYANDCDEDVCLSWYLLTNAPRIMRWNHCHLERLVHAVDLLDSTAGACLHPLDENLLREIAWIFEPYRSARLRGLLDSVSEYAQRSIIDAITQRIDAHLTGSGGTWLLDLRYERILAGSGWTMVNGVGAQARLGMVRDGVRAYVSVRPRADQRRAYTLGRTSPFVPFDVPRIVAALNQAEPPGQGAWGGGNLIAGSPRKNGSQLTLAEVAGIVAEEVREDQTRLTNRSRRIPAAEVVSI